jgi:hypothetical protein
MKALRELGYSLNSAVADVVDNSIAAHSKVIAVEFTRSGDTTSLVVRDDGVGMNAAKLVEALRLGSDSTYDEVSLSKYGMGLKSASLSQARRLIVASSPAKGQAPSGLVLDLEHISLSNRWELLRLDDAAIAGDERLRWLASKPGTCVVWEHLDRIDAELAACSSSAAASSTYGRIVDELAKHLRMTFHRFIEGEVRNHHITLILNGDRLPPWDPFCRAEPNTVQLPASDFKLHEGSGACRVIIRPYVLPVKDGALGFSSPAAWNDARGLLSWNDSQGYYVYRHDRLIHCGGWLRTRAKDEHTKYARVGLFIDSHADELFRLSVSKAGLRLPESLAAFLRLSVNPKVIKEAQQPYRQGDKHPKKANPHRAINAVMAKAAPELLDRHGVSVASSTAFDVSVSNRRGGYVANPVAAAHGFAAADKFSIVAGTVADGRLWRLVCRPDGGFTVVVNEQHPFYTATHVSLSASDPQSKFLDAMLFAMAYAELRTANTASKPLFDEIRSTISEILEDRGNQ